MTMAKTERFGLQRKIIANMTSAGWRHTPHACFVYEAEVSKLLAMLKEINIGRNFASVITLNTAMLKIVAEGIKASPKMNGHIRYNEHLSRGRVTSFEQINITTPMMVDAKTMMTVNLRDLGQKSMSEIRDSIADIVRRMKKTNLQQAMFEVVMHDTLLELKRLHVLKALGRLIGFWLDGGPKTLLHGAEKRAYEAIPHTERLTYRDLEQGTITVTNPGTLYKRWNGTCAMLEIVPPQIAAIAINMARNRALVGKDGTIRAGKTLDLTIAFDHRVLDAADLVPFIARIDQLISAPNKLLGMV